MRIQLSLATLIVLSLGCDAGTDRGDTTAKQGVAEHGGTLVVSSPGDADILLPPLVGTIVGIQVADVIYERLAEPGEKLNTIGDEGFTGELADSWTWGPDSLSVAFKLDPAARWHDGRPVRATDVRFTHQLYTNPQLASPVAPLLANIDSVSVPDTLTAVFWFKRRTPEQFFDAAFQMHVLPEHRLGSVAPADVRTSELVMNPVGSGQYRFVRWEKGARIELVADTAHYRGRPNIDRVIWTVAPDPNTAATKVMAGEADFIEYVRATDVPELAKRPDLQLRWYPSLDHGALVFNLRDPRGGGRPHPIFGDKGVRMALSMAVDRERLVQNVLDSLGVVSYGPFTRTLAMADTTVTSLPYDVERSKRMLDSLGWRDANGDGIREKNGRPLRFTIISPSSSTNRVRLAVLLQEALKQVGAQVDVENFEFTAFGERVSRRRFDAAMYAWRLDASPASIRQVWSSEAAGSGGGANYASYTNPTFDALVDSAAHQMDPARARAYYRRAYQTIIDDAPALWLYETKNAAGVHKRIRTTGMRADAWWSKLGEWYIPEAERIARDRVGLQQAAR
ncbi:MAG TPA: peptide ABC transporter substrate-binding protein [Gemmatimonadaceae bacterium]|nr:peptide ABC transporter substrate-binding protein [Gemmatimonadaceae bacterium]